MPPKNGAGPRVPHLIPQRAVRPPPPRRNMTRSMAAVVVDWADRVALDLLRRLLPAWLLGPVIGIVKRCLRWASGAGGEIERIAVRPAPAHRRMADLEAAMHRSRVVRPILLAMRAGDDVQAVAKRICAAKHVRAAALVSSAIAECLQAMQAMARLEQDLQSARRTPYDPADASHEALLNKVGDDRADATLIESCAA